MIRDYRAPLNISAKVHHVITNTEFYADTLTTLIFSAKSQHSLPTSYSLLLLKWIMEPDVTGYY